MVMAMESAIAAIAQPTLVPSNYKPNADTQQSSANAAQVKRLNGYEPQQPVGV